MAYELLDEEPKKGRYELLDDLPKKGGFPVREELAGSFHPVIANSVMETVAAMPDMFLNAPVNAYNLGKAAFGTGATALGRPDLAPELTETPNIVGSAFRKLGITSQQNEPKTERERMLASAASGATAGVPGGIPGMVLGAASNLIGDKVSALTGSPLAGLAANLVTPFGANKVSRFGAEKLAEANLLRSQKQPLLDTMKEVRDAGYVIPPSTTNPTMFNRILESMAGKTLTSQDASIKNSGITGDLIRKEIGLDSGEGITQAVIDAKLKTAGQPYADASSLAPVPPAVIGTRLGANGLGPIEPIFGKSPPTPDKLVHDWKVANKDAKDYWSEFNKSGSVEARDKALAAADKAYKLDKAIEEAAQNANRPEVADALRKARVEIAKLHTVDRAMNPDRGEVSALDLSRARDNGVPLNGNLLTAAKMGSSFKDAVKNPESIGSQGTHNLNSILGGGFGGSVGAALGGPTGAFIGSAAGVIGTPIAQSALRNYILSKGFQKSHGTPKYESGLLGKVASEVPLTPSEQVLLRSYLYSQSGLLNTQE